MGEFPWEWAALAVLPLALILVTSFLKFSVVLSLLRQALGAPEALPSSAVVAIAALLSAFVMAPVALEMQRAAAPALPEAAAWSPAQVAQVAAASSPPLLAWLERHSGPEERAVFARLGAELHAPADLALLEAPSPLVILPAFVLTELKEAFLIGFALYVPFLVLELVIAGALLSLGLQGLSPGAVSLPFKLLLFVMVDGWTLLVEGLILGYV